MILVATSQIGKKKYVLYTVVLILLEKNNVKSRIIQNVNRWPIHAT